MTKPLKVVTKTVQETMVQRYFETLWGPSFDELGLFVSVFSPESKAYKFHNSFSGLIEDCLDPRRSKENVFASVGAFAEPPKSGRGLATDVVALGGIWVDLDVKEGSFRAKDDALAFLGGLPLSASMIVDSGGGIHGYWTFREPWYVDIEDRDMARATVRGWTEFLASLTDAKIDRTADLARVMRVPGTHNHKPGAGGVMSTVVAHDGPRYNPSDFEDWAASKIFTPGVAVVKLGEESRDDARTKVMVARLKANDEDFAEIWAGRRATEDKSPSAICMSLANYLACGPLDDADIWQVLEHWRAERGATAKPRTWYARTIGKARAAQAGIENLTGAIDQCEEVRQHLRDARGGPVPVDLTEALDASYQRFLANTAQRFGLEFSDIAIVIHQSPRTGETEDSELLVEIGGNRMVVPLATLTSQSRWQAALMSRLIVSVRKLGSADWRAFVEELLGLARREMVADDLQPGESEIDLVHRLLLNEASDDVTQAYVHDLNYVDPDGVVWFRLGSVLQAAKRHGVAISKGKLVAAVKGHGGVQRTLNISPGGRRTSASFWCLRVAE